MKGKSLLIVIIILMLGVPLAGCGQQPAEHLAMAPLSDLPSNLQEASESVQIAYRFALANRELLEEIPCFCGCGGMGHTSNYDCYVADEGADGLLFDYHAYG